MAKHLLVFKPSKFWFYAGGALGIISDDLEQARQVISEYNIKVDILNKYPITEPITVTDHQESQGSDGLNEVWVFHRCYELVHNETPRVDFHEFHDQRPEA